MSILFVTFRLNAFASGLREQEQANKAQIRSLRSLFEHHRADPDSITFRYRVCLHHLHGQQAPCLHSGKQEYLPHPYRLVTVHSQSTLREPRTRE